MRERKSYDSHTFHMSTLLPETNHGCGFSQGFYCSDKISLTKGLVSQKLFLLFFLGGVKGRRRRVEREEEREGRDRSCFFERETEKEAYFLIHNINPPFPLCLSKYSHMTLRNPESRKNNPPQGRPPIGYSKSNVQS